MYDPSLSLATVEDQTVGFMKQIQAHCRSLGFVYSSTRASAMVTNSWRIRKNDPKAILFIDGWHGTGTWGRGKMWFTWYPAYVPGKPMISNDIFNCSKIDFVRDQGFFMTQSDKDLYLKNLNDAKDKIISYLNTVMVSTTK